MDEGSQWMKRSGRPASALAARAPVGGAVGVTLAAGGDRGAAAGARAPGAVVGAGLDRARPALGRAAHARANRLDHRQRLGVAERLKPPPGVKLGLPAALRLPDVADPGHVALVKQRIAQP